LSFHASFTSVFLRTQYRVDGSHLESYAYRLYFDLAASILHLAKLKRVTAIRTTNAPATSFAERTTVLGPDSAILTIAAEEQTSKTTIHFIEMPYLRFNGAGPNICGTGLRK
jgi:hypothetical protein